MQFVQWTLHSVRGHPILLDVLRRLVETDQIFQAYKVDLLRMALESGSIARPANKARGKSGEQATINMQKLALAQKSTHPWVRVRRVMRWMDGIWRSVFHELSVEEWTGPAVWTDAVFS